MPMHFMPTDYNLNMSKPGIALIYFKSSTLKDKKLYANHKVPILLSTSGFCFHSLTKKTEVAPPL